MTEWTPLDEQEFLAWKAERDEQHRKSGDYWITQEGRDYIREIYTDYLDGNAVLPLLDALERAEDRVRILEDRCSLSAEKACALLKAQLAATTGAIKDRDPLSADAVRKLLKQFFKLEVSFDNCLFDLVRDVERAHGIGETTSAKSTGWITHISLYPPKTVFGQWLAILRIASDDTLNWDVTENGDTAQEALAKGLATLAWSTSKTGAS